MFIVAPANTRRVAPEPLLIVCAPVQFPVPAFSSTKLLKVRVAVPPMVSDPPASTRTRAPAPERLPPFQVNALATDIAPAPAIPPPATTTAPFAFTSTLSFIVSVPVFTLSVCVPLVPPTSIRPTVAATSTFTE